MLAFSYMGPVAFVIFLTLVHRVNLIGFTGVIVSNCPICLIGIDGLISVVGIIQ
jgi:hypothetical protein